MTLSETLSFIRSAQQYDLDNMAGSSPSDGQLVSQVNWALRVIGRRLHLFSHGATLVLEENTAEYNLMSQGSTAGKISQRIIEPWLVIHNGIRLRDHNGEPGIWDYNEFESRYPLWRDADAGTPILAVGLPDGKMLLYPKPDAAAAALTCYVTGQALPNAMTVSGMDDELPISEELHEAVAWFAAEKSALPNLSEAEGWSRVQAYNAEWMRTVRHHARLNKGKCFDGRAEETRGRWVG